MNRKQIFIIFSIFALFLLCFSGCRLGSSNCQCQGLFSNKIINIPRIVYSCNNEKVDESKISIASIEKMNNSEGNGRNGYITVRLVLNLNVGYSTLTEVSYKVKVYDDNKLVGNVFIVRYYEEITEIITKNNGYVDYFNIPIEEYILGDYTFEVDNLKVYTSKKD